MAKSSRTAIHPEPSPDENQEDRIARLESDLETARETNRRLNRRVQNLESEQARIDREEGLAELRRRAEIMSASWHGEFERVLAGHQLMKEIYETVAPVLGLPWGRYNSVSDLRCGGGNPGRRVFANVYLTKQGGIESHDVAACVADAVMKLSSQAMPEGLKEAAVEAKSLLDIWHGVQARLEDGEEWGSFDCGLQQNSKSGNAPSYEWWLGYMQGALQEALQQVVWSFPDLRPAAGIDSRD